MKRIKKIARQGLGILVLILVLAVWLYSGFKIFNYLRPIPSVGAFGDFFIGNPPPPPPPPACSPTPTPVELTPTPIPETPTPTPTLSLGSTPTPTAPPGGSSGVGGPADGGGGQATGCNTTIPPTPTLLTVTSAGLDQAKLNWTAVDPTTHYAISYGLSSGTYLYGVSDTGKTTSFMIGSLNPTAKYCFAVRAVNDCAPGGLSNEICQGAAAGGQVLGVSTLGATGSATEQLFQIFYIIGFVCLALGIRLCGVAKRPAWF